MAEVLIGAGVTPDLIVGTSVGSLNGAWLASHTGVKGVEELRGLWLALRRRDIFPFSPLQVMQGLIGRRDHLVSSANLGRWLSLHAPFFLIQQTPIPLYIMATDLLTGKAVTMATGDVIEALLASSAIPGVFPPVEFDGRLLVDGGIAANTPISQAVDLGADTVYVLPTVGTDGGVRPRSAPGVTFHALSHLLGQASESEVRANADRCTLYVVPPTSSRGISPFDFSHSKELMDDSHRRTSHWLASAQPVT
jgi:NTE family protein